MKKHVFLMHVIGLIVNDSLVYFILWPCNL